MGIVRTARLLLGRGLGNGVFAHRGVLIRLVDARLNFVNHAKVADELRGMRVSPMESAIGIAVNGCRSKVRKLGLAPVEARGGQQQDNRGGDGNSAVNESRRFEAAQPALGLAPALRPSVTVKIASTSRVEGSTCSSRCKLVRTCETPATSGIQRPHPFT